MDRDNFAEKVIGISAAIISALMAVGFFILIFIGVHEYFSTQDARCQEYVTQNLHDTNQLCKFFRQAGIKCEVEK